MRLTLACAALTLAAGSAAGQQASYTFFGQGCSPGAPHFSVIGVPQIGGSFVVRAPSTGAVPSPARAFVLTGFSNTRFGGLRLPFDLSVLSGPALFCGPLLVSIDAIDTTPSHPSGSTVDIVYRVPSSLSLLGLSIYQQVLQHSVVGWPAGHLEFVTTSRGGHGVIGH